MLINEQETPSRRDPWLHSRFSINDGIHEPTTTRSDARLELCKLSIEPFYERKYQDAFAKRFFTVSTTKCTLFVRVRKENWCITCLFTSIVGYDYRRIES